MNQDASTAATAAQTPAKSPTARRRRMIILLVALVVTVVAVLGYWRYAELYPSTDNAYTHTNIVRVAPQISGVVAHVYVRNDDKISAGDPLLDLDPAPYEAALRNARAQFDAAANAAGTAADDLKNAATTLEEKRAALDEAIATYRDAKAEQAPGEPPSQQVTDALKSWHDALDQFEAAEAAFSAAQDKELIVTTPTVKLRAAAAQLDKATQDRVNTYVTSPGEGWVSNLRLRPGSVVEAGTPALALVEDGKWWVDANFKETDLTRIKPGQPATVSLDMYAGATFEGVVESISAGSGATFSVLPPENATGNWVKVTQRFPVRIEITSEPDKDRPLRVGASATVTVDTTADAAEGAQ